MKDKRISLYDFIASNTRVANGIYDQLLPYTERLFIEVDSSPAFVEVFVTVLPEKMTGKRELLISIPSWKYSFLSPHSVNNIVITLKLEEAQEKVQHWIAPVSAGIVSGVQEIYQKLLTKFQK